MREVLLFWGDFFRANRFKKSFVRLQDVHGETFLREYSKRTGTSSRCLFYTRARKAMKNDASNPITIIKGPTKSLSNELITLHISSRGGKRE